MGSDRDVRAHHAWNISLIQRDMERPAHGRWRDMEGLNHGSSRESLRYRGNYSADAKNFFKSIAQRTQINTRYRRSRQQAGGSPP